MALVKCTECGNMVSDNAKVCNNCGAPIVAAQVANEQVVTAIPVSGPQQPVQRPVQQPMQSPVQQPMPASGKRPNFTDTGYNNENAIKIYANICFWIFVVLVVLADIASLVLIGKLSDEIPTGFIILGVILSPILILLAYVTKAFLVCYANISINLHEINMKTN